MPTTLISFADTEIRMRYREPFLTEGLDIKMAVNTPPGIYRGFRLAPNGSAMTVTVVGDVAFSDHAIVYQDAAGHSLTIRRTGGNFLLDLSAFPNKTLVVAVYAAYALGSNTIGEIRVYELAPSDTFSGAAERPELVVLGTVVVPASGVIPDDSITHDRRTMAWETQATEAVPWSPITKNPSFEHGVTGDASRFSISDWDKGTIAINGNFQLGTATVRSGAKSLEFNKTNVAASIAVVAQYQEIPVTPGQLVRITGWIRQLIAPTAGDINFSVSWGDADSLATGSVDVPAVVIGSTDASFRQVIATVAVPVGAYILKGLGVGVINLTTGSTGIAFVVDDLQVYVENGTNLARPAALSLSLTQATLGALLVEDPLNYTIGQLAALVRFDQTTPSSEGELIIEAKDQDYAGGRLPPALAPLGRLVSVGKQLLGTAADARKARISTPYHTTFDATLIWESTPTPGTTPSVRLYVSLSGLLLLTINASYNGTTWNKDSAGSFATLFQLRRGAIECYSREADAAWTTWTQINRIAGASTLNTTFEALLAHYDAGGNRRTTIDHLGLPGHHIIDYCQPWMTGDSTGPVNPEGWTFGSVGTGHVGTLANGNVSIPLRLSFTTGNSPGDESQVYTNNYIAQSYPSVDNIPLQNVAIVLEWSAMNINFTNEPNFMCGWGDLPGGNQSGFFFQKNTADTNWKVYLRSSVGGTSIVDTGVPPGPPVGADHLFFRLEMYGNNSPGGKRFLAYINNALVASFTGADANLPTEPMRAVFRMYVSGTNGNNYFLGAVRWRCTERLTDGIL